ncbi:fibronectin type III domain-containing protein [Pyxidicoccus xibeiensis]|uniref:fibronectin type III domain-containing protein n=1 Tax=Pyxidicoccus xibeiensis TaxID=2906759 RepID=UPI0020A75E75|nr:fibronectin type III domain-containing protein [Pyxidicoccus xibeiensis]MCP3144829.1 fibronectin type III domain-containing protein [Pyxidicoccus xibeiensis]
MTNRLGAYTLSLLVLFGAVGCGDEASVPGDNRVPVAFDRPDAPTKLVVTPGNSQVTVSWTPPAYYGGKSITSYAVRALEGGTVRKTETSTTTSATVTGLTNGTSYVITVAAINEVGESEASEVSAAVMPYDRPGAPRAVTATPGDREVTVTWTEPEAPGLAISGYTVQLLSGETVVATQTVTGTSATFSELTNGTRYSVTVAASNAVLAGPASAPVAVTPRTVPGYPTLDARRGDAPALIILSTSIADDGGSPVKEVLVTIREGMTETVVRTASLFPPFTRSLSISTLPIDKLYSFQAVARNDAGVGPPSARVFEIPRSPPSPPTNLVVTPGDGRVHARWQPPTEPNALPVQIYRVSFRDAGGPEPIDTTELNITITGLTNGESYRVVVEAVNEAGISDPVWDPDGVVPGPTLTR